MKKALSFIMSIVLLSTATLTSCSKDNGSADFTATSATTVPVAEPLKNLESSGEITTVEFVMEMDTTLGAQKAEVSYYADTDVVCSVRITADIYPTHPSYEDRLREDKEFAENAKNKGDANLVVSYGVDENGIAKSVFEVNGLAKEDRTDRIAFTNNYLGAIPDVDNYAFYFTNMKTNLAAQGFYPAA